MNSIPSVGKGIGELEHGISIQFGGSGEGLEKAQRWFFEILNNV